MLSDAIKLREIATCTYEFIVHIILLRKRQKIMIMSNNKGPHQPNTQSTLRALSRVAVKPMRAVFIEHQGKEGQELEQPS